MACYPFMAFMRSLTPAQAKEYRRLVKAGIRPSKAVAIVLTKHKGN
jgi:hypothetical protein